MRLALHLPKLLKQVSFLSVFKFAKKSVQHVKEEYYYYSY